MNGQKKDEPIPQSDSRVSLNSPPSKRLKREYSEEDKENNNPSEVVSTTNDGPAITPTIFPSSVLPATSLPHLAFPVHDVETFRPIRQHSASTRAARSSALATRLLQRSSVINRTVHSLSLLNGSLATLPPPSPTRRPATFEPLSFADEKPVNSTSTWQELMGGGLTSWRLNGECSPPLDTNTSMMSLPVQTNSSTHPSAIILQPIPTSRPANVEPFSFADEKPFNCTSTWAELMGGGLSSWRLEDNPWPLLNTTAQSMSSSRSIAPPLAHNPPTTAQPSIPQGRFITQPVDENQHWTWDLLNREQPSSTTKELDAKEDQKNSLFVGERTKRKITAIASSTATGAEPDLSTPAYQEMCRKWKTYVYQSQSGIQGFGLYAMKDLNPGQMIVEYKGELIRSEVCEVREKRYKAQNRGDYMFRMDENWVIDATMKGGMARYINHSCGPNSSVHIMKPPNSSPEDWKVIVVAKSEIKAGVELTFDYNFEYERDNEKVECRCGSANCRGRLN